MFAKFNRINIKYGAAFIGVALALLVVVTANAMLVNSVKDRLEEVTSTLNRAISLVLNADRDLYQARMAEMAYLRGIPGTPEAETQIATYEENAAQAQERIQQVAGLMANYGDVSDSVNTFNGLYERWREESARSIQMYKDEDIGGAMEQIDGASRESFEQLRGFYDATGQSVDERVQELEATTLAQINRQQTLVIGFAVLVGLVAIAIALIGPHLMSKAIRQVSARIREITDGDGDLTARIQSHRKDEIGELAEQFNRFIERIDTTLQSVRTSTLSVNRASDEIAKGSQELASRTEQSAANLQQTSASMEEITTTVRNTSDAARQADELVQSTVQVARRGQEAMREVETTMGEISASSEKINEIITLIDGIAFQTNILALNASVEAARAGEHGRGFAVVAQEVRTLAGRSGDASREIRELVDRSVTSTQTGAGLVKNAGRTMEDIVASIDKVTRVISEISTGAQEQSQGIGQVNTAVAELDTMTQHNASMVEETSSAAEEMRHQAEQLAALIASFRLSGQTDDHGGERVPVLRAVAADRYDPEGRAA